MVLAELLLPGAGPESPTTLRESVFYCTAIIPTGDWRADGTESSILAIRLKIRMRMTMMELWLCMHGDTIDYVRVDGSDNDEDGDDTDDDDNDNKIRICTKR